MPTMDELVNVLVPRRHLSQVYGFIAKLDASEGQPLVTSAVPAESPALAATEAKSGGAVSINVDEWTPSRLRRMVEESPPAMLEILRMLADRPGEWLAMNELAKAIRPDADWNTVAGTLGAFGRRVKNRYGLESWPFENRYDYEVGGRVCRMSEEVARLVKRLVMER
jgi:hypothetical protein